MHSAITRCTESTDSRHGRLAASLVVMISVFRMLPWLVTARPRTPLRVLCLMAFDTVHVLRTSRRLSFETMRTLATLLDFGACLNDLLDGNEFSRHEFLVTRQLLEKHHTPVPVHEFLSRLHDLERRRPPPYGDHRTHRNVQRYRESVNRLSLGMIAATAWDNLTIEEGIQATYHDEDLQVLFRIVMHCQIIDDVLDFAKDKVDRLPSFLTAHASPTRALRLTATSARQYAVHRGRPTSPHLFPFHLALAGTSTLAQVAIGIGYLRLTWQAMRIRRTSFPNAPASYDAQL